MTACIAAIAADREGHPQKSVVIASDRMVTVFGMQEFEHEVPKLQEVSARAFALMAGDALRGSMLVKTLQEQFGGTSPAIWEVAKHAADKYAENRLAQIDAEVFRIRGITINEFYRGLQNQMVPQIAFNLDGLVSQYNYNLDLLFAGTDATGAHIFTVTNPGGTSNEWGQIGSAAIGSGGFHATQSLIASGHTPARSLAETVINVYTAKKRSEVAPGVGQDTDLVIIEPEKVTRLNPADIQELEKIYREKIVHANQSVEDSIQALEFYKEANNVQIASQQRK